MVIHSPGLEHYCLSFVQRGQGILCQPDQSEAVELSIGDGAICS